MAIARLPSVVLDCPDPGVLARFYAGLLDWTARIGEDWAEIRSPEGQFISFQRVEGYTPPRWPGQEVPQQLHLDFDVDDLDEAGRAAVEIGATQADYQPGTTFRVFLDPAGHPFCFCRP